MKTLLASLLVAASLLPANVVLAGEATLTTPGIAGVVRAGTAVELVRDGFESVEGPLPQADGGLLFTNNRANRIERLAPDGSLSPAWFEGPGGVNALTVMPSGEIAATLTERRAIAVVKPGEAPHVLVDALDGVPFNRPNDIVATKRGDLYFSDTAAPNATSASPPASIYRYSAKGELSRVTAEIGRPNGVALSPDERTLYVADTGTEWVHAFVLGRDGRPGPRRQFAKLAMPPDAGAGATAGSGADGIAVDARGRLFVATTVGVQVFSPRGESLGVIALPRAPQNLAFSGPGKGILYVVGRGAVYRIATGTQGPRRAGK